MNKESLNKTPVNTPHDIKTEWEHIADNINRAVYTSDDFCDERKFFSDAEITKMIAETKPFINKIDPKALKKCFDGWNHRKKRYREIMRQEDELAHLNDEDCNMIADTFYLSTIFRDYLDSILQLKNQGRTTFVLYDSEDEDVVDKGNATGWYDIFGRTINIVGDRIDTKFGFITAVAHEMWHAHQRQVAEEHDSELAKEYELAFQEYVDNKNPEKYLSQSIEGEARIFERQFREKLLEATEFSNEMIEELFAEINEPTENLAFGFDTFLNLIIDTEDE